jgi:hypothetical protein
MSDVESGKGGRGDNRRSETFAAYGALHHLLASALGTVLLGQIISQFFLGRELVKRT